MFRRLSGSVALKQGCGKDLKTVGFDSGELHAYNERAIFHRQIFDPWELDTSDGQY
jgi:hypothetical protein